MFGCLVFFAKVYIVWFDFIFLRICMLFCNISSDKVHICDAQGEIFLERNGIEKVLGPTLVDRAKKSPFDQVFLVNGPGGFTNLRV
ncbi:TPA: hypothetical protein DIC40_05815 [Patescibacteria group bacterium]|nr:hypothetical protein [Candidatus Gracilibacteria bacterium]